MSVLRKRGDGGMDVLLCSIPDAAKALGLGRSKVYELIDGGQLEAVSIGRRRLVRTNSVRAMALGDRASPLADQRSQKDESSGLS